MKREILYNSDRKQKRDHSIPIAWSTILFIGAAFAYFIGRAMVSWMFHI